MKWIKRVFQAVTNIAGFADSFRGRAEAIATEVKEAIEGLRTNVGKIAETIRSFRADVVPELVALLKELREIVDAAKGTLTAVSAQQRDLGVQVAKVRTDFAALHRDVGEQLASIARGDGTATA